MSIQELYQIYQQHPVVTTDSRNCPEGSLFFALKGEAFDGNKFAAKALELGSSYAIIDNAEFKNDERYILVEDVLTTMSALANHHRKQLKKPVLAITGTNGKTTTKELVLTALSAKYKICATKGNFNNHIGLPLTLLSATPNDDIIITEMGANHMGEIKHLCLIAEPNFGIITNIGKAHLEGFGSYENIIITKGELYDFIRASNGTLFINNNDKVLTNIADGIVSIPYGSTEAFELEIENLNPFLELRYKDANEDRLLQTHFIGAYNLINFKAAIAVGQHFEVETSALLDVLESYTPQNNRSQLTKTENNQIIQDAYNANPSSVALAIRNFESIKHPAKCFILGDMKELGEHSAQEHQKVVDMLAGVKDATAILIGQAFSVTNAPSQFLKFENAKAAEEYLIQHQINNQFILLKGSRSMQLEKLIPYL